MDMRQRKRLKINKGVLPPWSEVLNGDTFGEKLADCVDRVIRLENHKIQRVPLIGALLTNSTSSDWVPIVAINGPSGAGKTTILDLAKILHRGVEKYDEHLAGDSTTASNRNDINAQYWENWPEDYTEDMTIIEDDLEERVAHAATFDNVYIASFEEPRFYSMMLRGYKHGAVSKKCHGTKGNISHQLFTLKFLTTVDDIYRSNLTELRSRILPISVRPIEWLTEEDIGDFDTNWLNLKNVDWEGFREAYIDEYRNDDRYIEAQEFCEKHVRKLIKGRRWEISLEPISSYCHFFPDEDIPDVVAKFLDYWGWVDSYQSKMSECAEIISYHLMDLAKNELCEVDNGFPLDVGAHQIKDFVDIKVRSGELTKPNIETAMAELGYRKVGSKKSKSFFWTRRREK